MRLLLVCVLVALLAPAAYARPVSGESQDPPLTRPLTGLRITESLRLARDFWDDWPPCDVRVYAATPDELELSTLETGVEAATFMGVQGPECPIWLSTDLLAPTVENRIDTGTAITHELGHRLGYAHDDTPGSIMYEYAWATPWPVFARFAPRGYLRTWRENHADEPWATRP